MALGRDRSMGWRRVCVGVALLLAACATSAGPAPAQDKVARIGVLAYRGMAAAETRWQPLIRYLGDVVPGWRFELVPVTLITAPERLEANSLDFIITNPGHYVTLAERFQLSALATRERRHPDRKSGLLHFGTAIFTRAERGDIETLADLGGGTLAAVSAEAFGGFQMAWYEFHRQGLDPFATLKAIRFKGFPQDQIVADVLAGKADAGVVRSGLLEALAREGRLELSQVKVLLGNAQTAYPFLVSSRLYPEWPFAARLGTDRRLAEAVLRALLGTQDRATARRYTLTDLWSAPLSYESVRAVLSAYRARGSGSPAGAPTGLLWIVAGATIGLAGLALGFLAWHISAGAGATARLAPEGASDGDISQDQRARFEALTRREREVLRLICHGEPTKRIAEALHISPKTVEYHRANLLQKTDAGSTPRLVGLATKLGFDQAPPPRASST
ncbi:MAG: PhnD/SsuA/transferrin family substrate-binding protein [Hyphomicrobiales bacterium]|nr:PhnD/SsuA/transferrin family substrate-binding protein [Hyphomicrobiales bacterium]